MKRERKTIAKNRRAFHEYEILERFEAGIELSGTEGCPDADVLQRELACEG